MFWPEKIFPNTDFHKLTVFSHTLHLVIVPGCIKMHHCSLALSLSYVSVAAEGLFNFSHYSRKFWTLKNIYKEDHTPRTADRGWVQLIAVNRMVPNALFSYVFAAASRAQWGLYKFPLYLWLQLIDMWTMRQWCLKKHTGFLQSYEYFLNHALPDLNTTISTVML
jgi:hypothetical protein